MLSCHLLAMLPCYQLCYRITSYAILLLVMLSCYQSCHPGTSYDILLLVLLSCYQLCYPVTSYAILLLTSYAVLSLTSYAILSFTSYVILSFTSYAIMSLTQLSCPVTYQLCHPVTYQLRYPVTSIQSCYTILISHAILLLTRNKSQCIRFATPNFIKLTETFQITIDDTVRHMEDKVKNLGVIFDSRLSFEHHIKSL